MGKLQAFEVVFEGDDFDVFSSGQIVNGFIKIVLSEPKNDVESIRMKFKGKAHTHWMDGTDDEDLKTYSGRETYFKEKLTCFGKDGKKKHSLDAGEHCFPFSFEIPDIPLPFPFESEYGWIRYKVKCKINRPSKFDHTTERLFTVTGYPIDLRTIPSCMHPVHVEGTKHVCCLCCETGPIITRVSVDKGGYVPGENIFVSGTVENNTNHTVLNLSVGLRQTVKYYSKKGRVVVQENSFFEEKALGCGCEGGGVARLDWKPHLIPAISPTGPQGCSIIKIEYVVRFGADVEDTAFDGEVFIPITIGTVPVYRPVYSDPSNVVVHQPTGSAPAPPPPSYAVALWGLQEIPSKSGHDYTFGKLMYAPKYPTYNLSVQPPTWDFMHPPPIVDPTYPLGGYPPPGDPSYPPVSGYPPPADATGDAPAGSPDPTAPEENPPTVDGDGIELLKV